MVTASEPGIPQDIIKNALNPSTRQASIEYVTVGTLLRRAVSDISLQQLGLEGSDHEQYPIFSKGGHTPCDRIFALVGVPKKKRNVCIYIYIYIYIYLYVLNA